jgi:hypothetical protein
MSAPDDKVREFTAALRKEMTSIEKKNDLIFVENPSVKTAWDAARNALNSWSKEDDAKLHSFAETWRKHEGKEHDLLQNVCANHLRTTNFCQKLSTYQLEVAKATPHNVELLKRWLAETSGKVTKKMSEFATPRNLALGAAGAAAGAALSGMYLHNRKKTKKAEPTSGGKRAPSNKHVIFTGTDSDDSGTDSAVF